MRLSHAILIEEQSTVGEARRFAQGFTHGLGFGLTAAGTAALIATELATNIVKHAGRGEILIRALPAPARTGLELLALDRGPGMRNVAECMRDGYSSAGSPGTGLGAVSRLSQVFEIYTGADVGTAVLARLWDGPAPRADGVVIGAVCLPKPGEEYCGDSYAVDGGNSRTRLLVVDGLGHGPLAAAAADAAVTAFCSEKHMPDPKGMLAAIHQALRRTRGAAAAAATIDFADGVVRYAGVGNIAASIATPSSHETRRLISQNGTAGAEIRKAQELSYPWPPGSRLLMHSDGLATQWQLERYPGLLARDPALIAAVLYRDYRRATDDVTVLVAAAAAPAPNPS